jgi:diguanylate cyclase (GGDEF)-like protein/PAS domain S-box-containing protein
MAVHRVYELMTTDVVAVSKDTSLSEAVEKLAYNNISSIVITEGHAPIGIITERDMAKIAASHGINGRTVSEFMSKNPVAIYKNSDIISALETMERNRIRRLVVTGKNGRLRGIITYSDIIKKLEEDFFKVHTTIDTVTTKEILKAAPQDTLRSAIEKMSSGKKSCILVGFDDSTLGILTERDVVRLLVKKTSAETPVKDVCTKNIIYANANTLIYDAIKIMNERGIRHLVVVDERLRLQGIVTQSDIIGLLHENITKGMRDQLERFKESLDMLQTGFIEFELNDEGTILYVNRHGARELGFDTAESAIGSSFAALLKDGGQWPEFVNKANGSPIAANFIFSLKDKKVIDGSFRIRKFAANGIFKDITDRFVETEHVRGERNRFENILKTLSEGLLIYDRNGIVMEANQTALNMLGTTKDEIIGRPYNSLGIAVMDETGNKLGIENMCVSEVIKKGIAVKNVIRGIKKADGSVTWFTASITPVLDKENNIEGIVHVLTDITELYNLEKRNQKILETAKEGYWEVRLDGLILKVNRSLSRVLGYREEELIGKSIYDLVDEKNKKIFERALERRREGIAESYEITLKHKTGSDVYAIISASPRTDPSGKTVGAFAFITDVTDLKSTHNTLHALASFYKDLTRALTESEAYEILRHYLLLLRKGNAAIDAIYFMNITEENKVADAIQYNDSGFSEKPFPGLDKCKTYIYAGNFVVNDLSREYACPHQRLDAKSGSYYCFAVNSGGAIMGILHLYSKAPHFFTDDIKETIDSFIALFAPVVANMRLLELNKKLSIIDPLTGLYNRRFLETFIDKQLAMADRNSQPLSVIMADIDNFKEFNDANGHDAGDTALRSVTQAISKNIRTSDIGVRYGGEEFMVVLPNTDKESALEIGERIRITLESMIIGISGGISAGRRKSITSSFGIATYPMDAGSFDGIIAKADKALYEAKRAGKNNIRLA